MNKCTERIFNGLVKENPTFVLMLGMCPTLAVTTSAINGIGMGLSTTAVLVMSNMLISMLRKIIPDSVRMPAFIVVVASFVTIVDFLLEGFVPSLYASLGLYIPLIVVNCIILGRAESYASKNPVLPSIFDGIGMGLTVHDLHPCTGRLLRACMPRSASGQDQEKPGKERQKSSKTGRLRRRMCILCQQRDLRRKGGSINAGINFNRSGNCICK